MNKAPMHDGKAENDGALGWNSQSSSAPAAPKSAKSTAARQVQTQSSTARPPSEEAIAERAYAKYLARGSAPGQDQEDWAAARQELVEEGSSSP